MLSGLISLWRGQRPPLHIRSLATGPNVVECVYNVADELSGSLDIEAREHSAYAIDRI